MISPRVFVMRLRGLFGKQQRDRELEMELESHLQLHIDDNLGAGMTADEARRQALLKLGGIEQTKESYRDRRGIPWLETLLQDVRFGLRTLRKNPGFTAVAILTLALGIGANTAIFSLINAVMIRSLPYGDASRLVYIHTPSRDVPQFPREWFSPFYAEFFDIQKENHSFSKLAMFQAGPVNIAAGGMAQGVGGTRVSADFFAMLETPAELGRTIGSGDCQPGHEHVAVISHALWQTEFGGAAGVLGATLLLNGESFQIIGVMPPAFHYPQYSPLQDAFGADKFAQVWLPLALTPQQASDRDNRSAITLGRLRPGVTTAQAQAEMSTLIAHLNSLRSNFPFNRYAYVEPLETESLRDVRSLMWWLLGAVSLVLLIACGNAANLLLTRAVSRMPEMGVRYALGAARARLVRQMMTEAILLACFAGALGVPLAWLGIRVLLRFNPGTIPRIDETSIDGRVLTFSLGVVLLTGILFGMLPAIAASRIAPASLFKQVGNSGMVAFARLRRGLIVAEVGLAVILLASAGLFIRSYAKLTAVDTGFSQSPLSMNLSLDARYGTPKQRQMFFRNVMSTIATLPGVQEAGAISFLPLSHSETVGVITAEGYANQENQLVEARDATEDYFKAIGTPLIEGRSFNESEVGEDSRVVIVNENFARKYFPNQDALGKHVCYCSPTSKDFKWSTIVGVVVGVRNLNLEDEPSPQIYTPFWSGDNHQAYIVIRTNFPPDRMISSIRRAVQGIDPALAVADIQTMEHREEVFAAPRRFQTFLFAVFAGVALLLAAVGLYGTIAYSVRQRTQEIGIRLALGAQRTDILRTVIYEGMALTVLGLVLGLAGALGVVRLLGAMLYGVAPNDPSTFVIVSVVLALAALAACYIPAWRATKIDPMVALRYE